MYIFHSDSGHAWLAVKRSELIKLGILNRISSCSYQKGDTVYLEEDCDADVFIIAKKAIGEHVETEDRFKDNSPIRKYDCFV